MPYLIDTNIAIHALERHEGVIGKYVDHDGEILISALVVVELLRGLVKFPKARAEREAQLRIFLDRIPVLSFDRAAAEAYSRIISQLGWSRSRDFDRMIAAHAISTQSVLVTNNEADFRDIPGLKVENWAAG